MDPNVDKFRMMQAEMARFENEISGQFMRPPMPRFRPDMTLRFLPHSLQRGPGAAFAPPPSMHMPRHPLAPPGHHPHHPLRAPLPPSFRHQTRPSMPPNTSAVIEGAPTKYAPQSTNPPPAPIIGLAPAVFQDFDMQQRIDPPAPPPPIMPSPVLSAKLPASVTNSAQSAETPSKSGTPINSSSKKSGGSSQSAAGSSGATPKVQPPRKYVRTAGGEVWADQSLLEWDPNDYRIFCGDLGNEVSDELLAKAFRKYPSFQKAKVIREKRTNKTKGYGFVSFKDPQDFIRALREMDGKYVGNRPIKLRKSSWKDRNLRNVKKKEKEKKKLGLRI